MRSAGGSVRGNGGSPKGGGGEPQAGGVGRLGEQAEEESAALGKGRKLAHVADAFG